MASSRTVTTSYLLENLHCPSCVTLIKTELNESYGKWVKWVSPNLVTSVVTVEHEDCREASVHSMRKTLEDVGFQVCAVDSNATVANDLAEYGPPEHAESSRRESRAQATSSVWSRLWPEERSSASELDAAQKAHLENCEECRSLGLGKDYTQDTKHPIIDSFDHLPSDGLGHQQALQGVISGNEDAHLSRATLSIEGMTCAVCVNTITEEIQKIPWVSRIAVNLVTNSASVDFTDPGRVQEIVDSIEDLGYDASIDKVVNLDQVQDSKEWREVQIRIEGMFCPRCPERLVKSLVLLSSDSLLQVRDSPSLSDPIVKLRYKPNPPDLTIRHILRTISAIDSSLTPLIYHPPTLEEKSKAIRQRHQRALWWRAIMTFVIAIPTFVLGIVYMTLVPEMDETRHFLMQPWTHNVSRIDVILCLLATPVWLFAADIFHKRAIKEVRFMWHRGSRVSLAARFFKFGSMNMLMSLGTTVAYISSVAQMIAAATSNGTKIPEGLIYFDSVVFLTLFLLGGRLIESYSKSRTGNAVEELVKLRPETAALVEKDKLGRQTNTTIPLDQLEAGDTLLVPKGASPPADGVIIAGETTFDESSLTGESRPIKKNLGDDVFAGTINQKNSITMKVTSREGKSMLDQIMEVVREGQTKRAPVEQIADTLTSYFVPIITLIAICTWIVWLALGLSGSIPDESFSSSGEWVAYALRYAIAVFVVACPCGIGLAAPTAIFVGGGLAAKNGILAKGGGEAFEKAHKIDCVVFDKTGTLTEGGDPQITDSVIFPEGEVDGLNKQTFWSALKVLEENSSHPIAKAIAGFCGSDTIAVEVENIEEASGKGMTATCQRDGRKAFDIAVGNELLIQGLAASMSDDLSSQLNQWKTEAKSVAIVAVRPDTSESWIVTAAMAISDPLRSETVSVVKALHDSGIQVWMLSGDNAMTAQAVAQRVGIHSDNVLAEVLPSEKADKIKYLQATLPPPKGHSRAMVAMVGDGINDSPALTAADVGIAIGSGSDVAISSAEFVLATSNLGAVLTLLDLSRVVFRRIKFNFAWALVYNMVAIPFAAGCFYPLKTSAGSRILLPPEFAALAMALSSISVVLSSLSLRTRVPMMGFRPRSVIDLGSRE